MPPAFSCRPLLRALLLRSLVGIAAAVPPGREDAQERGRLALRLARERNDPDLVASLEAAGRQLRQDPSDRALAVLAGLEERVGIDPGGWSMAGQPLFHPTPEMKARLPALAEALGAAMASGEAARVRAVTERLREVLGDQAGLPDARRPGVRVEVKPLPAGPAVRLFVAALRGEESRLRPLLDGKPLPGQMARVHGNLLEACTIIRPLLVLHAPADLPWLDRLADGAAGALLALQQPGGHFPFPDLRGRNLRFGDLIAKSVAAGQAEVKDGWVVSVDPAGGSQFDTGVCGSALLRAGRQRGNAAWQAAGRRAADWALGQPGCANFNYNAFSVSLLAEAFADTGERRYLEAAWSKFQVGVAPGQAPNGRWLDSHNARTVYHVIILRALADLAAVLPADGRAQREELAVVTRGAVAALRSEFDAMGVTVEALPPLVMLSRLDPADARLRADVARMAAGIVAKCTDGRRVKLGTQPEQLAAVARVEW